VINTDAEAAWSWRTPFAYAKQLGCTHLVDAATLTGAVVVALSNVNIGVFGSDQAFTDQLLASSRVAGEKMWPLPWMTNTARMIKERHRRHSRTSAPAKAVAPSWAPCSSGIYRDTPWIHFDIAEPPGRTNVKPWAAKARRAWGVRTLVDLAMKFGTNGSSAK